MLLGDLTSAFRVNSLEMQATNHTPGGGRHSCILSSLCPLEPKLNCTLAAAEKPQTTMEGLARPCARRAEPTHNRNRTSSSSTPLERSLLRLPLVRLWLEPSQTSETKKCTHLQKSMHCGLQLLVDVLNKLTLFDGIPCSTSLGECETMVRPQQQHHDALWRGMP